MPFSTRKATQRQREWRAAHRQGGTLLLSKAEVRRLHRLGVSPARFLTGARVSLDEYRDLQRQLEAKTAHLEWQKGGIRMLWDEIATLRATIETIKAVDSGELALQRVVQLEASQALREALGDIPGVDREVG